MQSKVTVKKTQMHKVYQWKCTHPLCCGDEDKCDRENDCKSSGKWMEKPVAEGKVIFVKEPSELKNFSVSLKDGRYQAIVISETEKINNGDWFVLALNHMPTEFKLCKMINTVHNKEEQTFEAEEIDGFRFICGYHILYKVLVLPEQFSPKDLQTITKGKMKDDNKVVVECILCDKDIDCKNESSCNISEGCGCKSIAPYHTIKITEGYATLHLIEEKMVPMSLLEKAFNAAREEEWIGGRNFGNNENYELKYNDFKQWFEQTIKSKK
jgi:hypothetical protein